MGGAAMAVALPHPCRLGAKPPLGVVGDAGNLAAKDLAVLRFQVRHYKRPAAFNAASMVASGNTKERGASSKGIAP